MDEMPPRVAGSWVPQACTLPAVEQPVRLAEFDDLFAAAVRSVDRLDPLQLRLELTPEAAVAARVAELVVRESECCSFFTFTLTATGGRLQLDMQVPEGQTDVLEALADRAAAGGSVVTGGLRSG